MLDRLLLRCYRCSIPWCGLCQFVHPRTTLTLVVADLQGKKYEMNVCGEGGEYETMTLDSPLFVKRVVM